MKFVISAAFQPPEHLVPIAIAADEAGYEAIASSDHAVYPETLDTPYPYTEDGVRRYDETSHFPDPWVLAGALSSVTSFERHGDVWREVDYAEPANTAGAVDVGAV